MITSYNELPIGKFVEFTHIPYEGREEVDYMLDIVSLLSDKTVDELSVMPITEFSSLCAKTHFLQHMPEVGHRRIEKVRLGSWNLRVTKGAKYMQTNQYVDFQNFIQQGNDAIVQQLSCILIPEGMKYCEGYDVADLQKAIAEMPTQTALDVQAFFLRRSLSSIVSTLISLEWTSHFLKNGKEIRTMIREERKHLQEAFRQSGAGSMP